MEIEEKTSNFINECIYFYECALKQLEDLEQITEYMRRQAVCALRRKIKMLKSIDFDRAVTNHDVENQINILYITLQSIKFNLDLAKETKKEMDFRDNVKFLYIAYRKKVLLYNLRFGRDKETKKKLILSLNKLKEVI